MILANAEQETDEKYTALKEEIQKEWDKLLVRYKYLRRNFIILGVKLYSVKDWSKANIKRPSDTFWKPVNKNK